MQKHIRNILRIIALPVAIFGIAYGLALIHASNLRDLKKHRQRDK